MSRLVFNSLKNRLQKMYDSNIEINIGIYDDNDNIVEEKNIPLGNYLNDPLPSKYEKKITESLIAKFAKI